MITLFGQIFMVIGAAYCAYHGMGIFLEFVRAARQSHRIASAYFRWHKNKRRITWKAWWKCFLSELGDHYSYTSIGCYSLPWDPNQKARMYR